MIRKRNNNDNNNSLYYIKPLYKNVFFSFSFLFKSYQRYLWIYNKTLKKTITLNKYFYLHKNVSKEVNNKKKQRVLLSFFYFMYVFFFAQKECSAVIMQSNIYLYSCVCV